MNRLKNNRLKSKKIKVKKIDKKELNKSCSPVIYICFNDSSII